MGFSFGGLNTATTKKAAIAELVENIIQIDHLSSVGPRILVLLDEFYSPAKLKKITIFLERNGIRNFRAITSLNCKIAKEDLKGELAKFYRINQSKWESYLEDSSAILSVGAALYAINQSADLMVNDFYDAIFNKTYYWSKDAKKYVYPIDSFNELFMPLQQNPVNASGPVNTFKTHFAEYQCKQILSGVPRPIKTPEKIIISYADWKKLNTGG